VIKGDMSLVGPRPEMLENVERYKRELPAFVYREKMKAGITGYAQIEGKYNTTPQDKLMLDLTYIESYSIWLDIKLIFRTLTVFFKSDSSQGFIQEKPEDQLPEYPKEKAVQG
jgi:lipopolysaccharide/colanic/teichoic acid biosynthesis glycosyltransferase